MYYESVREEKNEIKTKVLEPNDKIFRKEVAIAGNERLQGPRG